MRGVEGRDATPVVFEQLRSHKNKSEDLSGSHHQEKIA
jgi:hypothetical protein